MTPELGTPLGHRKLIEMMQAQKAAESAPDAEAAHTTGGRRCRLRAIRHQTTGQFYALSQEDRLAFDTHCAGILQDLQPANHRERWLATSIAEDQWRLNRARALENNIFAIGMSGDIADATDADSPEVHAAVCQARVWLRDGRNLQLLALYEQRLRRGIEKNEKQLRELQAERKAAHDKALEEAVLLAELDIAEGRAFHLADDPVANGFGFSASEITRLARRNIRLRQAARLQKAVPASLPRAA
jgi:hypothetical protein